MWMPLRTAKRFSGSDDGVQCLAVDELHGQEVNAAGLFDGEHAHDAGMVEGGERPGLALETLEPPGGGRHLLREHLDGDVAPELRVGGAIHLSHSALPELRADLVGPELRSRIETHEL